MEITAKLVKELRDKTGVGMMDCKKALSANNGNIEEAVKYLREKGIAKAAKKSDRETKEGRVFAYIHSNAKIGVLVEVNCETDFVARTDDFLELCKNIAMHIAASAPIAVSKDDLDEKVITAEREIYYNKAINDNKPDNIANKIADGQVQKFIKQNCLLDQEYVREPDKSVQDVITEAVAKLGENLQVSRFTRYSIT